MEAHRRRVGYLGIARRIATGTGRGLWALAAVVLAGVIAGCAASSGSTGRHGVDAHGIPRGFISWEFVKARPEGQLIYPGAELLRPIGWGSGQAGSPSATYGGIYRTSATPAQIYAWYGSWLNSHGWQDHQMAGASTWDSVQGFQRNGRELFVVAMDDPKMLGVTLGTNVPSNETVFEYRYSIYPPGSVS